MKKFLVLFSIILFSTMSVNAEAVTSDWNTSQTMDLAPSFSRVMTNALGMNFFARKTAAKIIKKKLNTVAPGDYDVNIDSYSAIDLKNGKFKSLNIHGSNISSKGFYVSAIDLNTLSDYNYIDYKSNPIQFKNDFPMSFTATISENDLNKTLINMGYIKKLTDINFVGISLFTVDNVAFKLKNNKIYLIAQMKAPFLMGEKLVKFTFSGKLNVENGKIVLDDVCSENLKNISLNKFVDKINNMNLFDLPLDVFKGTETNLSIKDVKIVDNKILVNGTIIVKGMNTTK